jgi:hypothetical protein
MLCRQQSAWFEFLQVTKGEAGQWDTKFNLKWDLAEMLRQYRRSGCREFTI